LFLGRYWRTNHILLLFLWKLKICPSL
jgi:hypothetical protein